jgi:hypothetical protein
MMNQFKRNVCATGGKSRRSRGVFAHTSPAIGVFSFFMRAVLMRHTQSMKYANTETTLMSLPPLVCFFHVMTDQPLLCGHVPSRLALAL